jgi:hypothetical protein
VAIAARLVLAPGEWIVAAAFFAAAATVPHATAATSVTLDFEGVGNNNRVGNFYGPGGGRGADYGVAFGTAALGAVDSDEGGKHLIANEPSANTTLVFPNDSDPTQTFLDVPGGFTSPKFGYASERPILVILYEGLNRTGRPVGISNGFATPLCGISYPPCGDPTGKYGVWNDCTISSQGAALSAAFKGGAFRCRLGD